MKFTSPIHRRHAEQGYIMMTLLLIMALMIIFAAVIVPEITFEIKRDREEEMIHRGVQYSRAIRAYYKKFGRYPAKIEDLVNTNQQRFLRKKYKDPITNKDFRLLHYGEAKLSLNGMGGGMIPGANPIGAAGGLNGPGVLSQPSAFGGASAFGANSSSPLGQPAQAVNPPAAGDGGPAGSDSTQPGDSTGTPGTAATASSHRFSDSSSPGGLSNTTFGGAPIVGVASLSKDATIRIFDKKKKYNEWQFVYDPTMDRGLLITTPYQQQTGFGVMGAPNLNGQINGPNAGSSGFGSSPGMQNTPSPMNSGFGNPAQPTDMPLQK